MAIDRAEEYDVPAGDGDRASERAAGPEKAVRRGDVAEATTAEERDRSRYYDALIAATRDAGREFRNDTSARDSRDVSAETSRAIARDGHGYTWDRAVQRFQDRWAEHERRWPADAREPVDRSADPEGSWRGTSNRYLSPDANTEVDIHLTKTANTERDVISPGMRAIETADLTRELAGWDHRLKAPDRLKDKVAADIALKSRSVMEGLAGVKDAVRYTFCYDTDRYTGGVRTDVERLKAHGFEEVELRNSWAGDHYKGINSRWREPGSGQLFEVQFHTHTSFECKQLTHGAYERLRNPRTTDAERDELDATQRDLCRRVPPPPGVDEIRDFQEEKQCRKK